MTRPRAAPLRGLVAALLAVLLGACSLGAPGGGDLGASPRAPGPPGASPPERAAVPTQPPGRPAGAGGAAAEAAEVRIEVTDDPQAVLDAHPPGTRFVLAAGVHRAGTISPRDGDSLRGEPGAVLSGARVLTAFRRDGDHWVAADQSQEGFVHGETEPGGERDAHPEEVFVDGRRLRHAGSREEVVPGAWFFDYPADQIVLGDDPRNRLVETSVTERAIDGEGARGVSLSDLTVRHYANPAQVGAISGDGSRSWTVSRLDASDNHGVGIRVGPGWLLEDSRVTGNGQLGVGGDGEYVEGLPILVRRCEIAGNRTLRYQWGWEGGATKFTHTVGMVFEHNWVHDNRGPGPWFDLENRDAVIRSNLVERNTHVGIFYEVSSGARIYWNEVRDNGALADGDLGAGVFVSNSSDVEVAENLLAGNRHEILALHDDRGGGRYGRYETVRLSVHDNDVTVDEGEPGLRVISGEWELYSEGGSRFFANTYRLVDPSGGNFYWGEVTDVDGWQAAGQDLDGTFLEAGPPGSLPVGAVPFARARYGPAP